METIIGGGTPPPADLIKDSNTQSFVEDVIRASQKLPVIVDFWAPWCGPCRQLGPAIEKVVKEAKGKVRLVKINIDENPEIAEQLRIQSIPAVFAFQGGQPVDGFVGALPESRVREFVKRLIGDTGPSALDQAQAEAKRLLEAGSAQAAAKLYDEILKHAAGDPVALAGLVRCYVVAGDLARAKQTLAMVAPEHANHSDVVGAKAALALAEEAGKAGDVGQLRSQVGADPADHKARYDLALALIGTGEREAAVDELLEIVRRNREWNDQSARKQLVKLFEASGPADPLTVAGRRRLSALLFS